MHRVKPSILTGLVSLGFGAGLLLSSSNAGAQVKFKDAANVCPWSGRADFPAMGLKCTKTCSDDLSVIDDCYNADAPPAPSLLRPLEVAGIVPEGTPGQNELYWDYYGPVAGQGSALYPIDLATAFFPHGQKNAGMTAILPNFRSSNDARLQLTTGNWGVPALAIFRPEALDYDYAVKPHPWGGAISPLGPVGNFEALVYQNPLNTSLDFTNYPGRKNEGIFIHNTICEDSSDAWAAPSGRTRNPIACRAPKTFSDEQSGSYVSGDCYQISVLFNGSQDWDAKNWEMRSVALTVFVPSPKRDGVNVGGVDEQRPWIYPRLGLASSPLVTPTLPAHENYGNIPWSGMGGSAWLNEIQTKCYGPPGSPRPGWCQFLDNQKRRSSFTLHHAGGTETWNGDGTRQLFEPSVTGDGRLLLMNLGGFGLAYSYNALGPCRADGWSDFKHVSEMPWDTAINTRYPIAKNQSGCGPHTCGPARYFRDTKGRDIKWRDPIQGAYGWIDREGRNIFFSLINESRDGWKSKSQSNCAPGDPCANNAKFLNPDVESGKGVVALGAWTQGKMVLLDNGLNFTDFGNQRAEGSAGRPSFQMALYQDDPATAKNEADLTIRPKASSNLNSAENQLNYYDAMSPTLPNDVVWTFSSDTQHNAEVAFDEYLRNDALVVAHMNAAVEKDAQKRWFPDDGFAPTNAGAYVRYETNPANRGGYYFKKSPRLQNASTADTFFDPNAVQPPSDILLRGGARIEPMGVGGVLGKGVYLDGKNDFLDVGGIYTTHDDWYYGVWLDSREDDDNYRRIVFHFADQSFIEMSRREIVTFDVRVPGPGARKSLSIAKLGLKKGKYFHFGVSITTEGAERVLRFSINGTRLGGGEVRYPLATWNQYDRGFQNRLQSIGDWGWYVVGGVPQPNHPNAPGGLAPFKGWIDELRTYRVSPQLAAGSYFDEFACNLALGTLVKVKATGEDVKTPQLNELYYTAYRHGLVSTPPWRIAIECDAAEGDVCTAPWSDVQIDCPTAEICDEASAEAGTCAAGEVCEAMWDAGIECVGDVCYAPGNGQPACADGADCAAGVALAAAPSGAPVDAVFACADGTDCVAPVEPSEPAEPIEPGEPVIACPEGESCMTPIFGGFADDCAVGEACQLSGEIPVKCEPGEICDFVETAYVCEQMILKTYDRPLDFPPQGHARACIDRVHKNPNPNPTLAARCKRKSVLGVSSKALAHNVARPDFTPVEFCKSCHASSSHLASLGMDALLPGSTARQADKRRQPLDVPAVLFGRVPVLSSGLPQGPLASPGAVNGGLPLDQFFDTQPKIAP